MKKIFTYTIIASLLFTKIVFAEKEKIYTISLPSVNSIEKELLIRYCKIIVRYYATIELAKEIKDFAFLAIKDVNYLGLTGNNYNFSVLVETDINKDRNYKMDDEIIEIFKIFLNDWERLEKIELNKLNDELLSKYEKDLQLIEIISEWPLFSNKNRNLAKERLREMERKLTFFDKEDIKIPLILSYLNSKAGYGIKAEEVLKTAVSRNPNEFILRNRYAILLKEMGKFDKAIEEFESNISIFRKPISYFYLGMTYKNKEECQLAVKNLNEFIQLAKDDFEEEKAIARSAIMECEEGFRNIKRKNKIKGKRRKI